jgi:preprotein translocase subunit SecF
MSSPTTLTEAAPEAPKRRHHTIKDFYHERTHFNFIDRSWRWAALSGTLILISVIAFGVRGLNLGIDFEGGTQWQFTVNSGSASVDDVRSVLDGVDLPDAKVLILGDDSVRVQAEDLSPARQLAVSTALAKYGNIGVEQVLVKSVGPTWGDKVSSKALQALVVFFIVIALYLTFRFEWRMALAALVAVIHDIIITVGVYSITQFEVVPATVVAFLTILGYSLYDTVVVFDKVRDNQARIGTERGDTYSAMVNRSLNQVLMRSINTSLVAVLPVASLLFVGTYLLGGLVLRDFALALFVGLIVGAYSSIFVATPVLAWLKEREPRYRALRARAESDLARGRVPQPVAPTAAVAASAGATTKRTPTVVIDEIPADADAVADDMDDGDAIGPELLPAEPMAADTTAPTTTSRPSTTTPYGAPTANRGAAAPRPRQQRRKKRR